MQKFRLHWSVHPSKDQAWYENEIEVKQMTEDEVARELDINYSLSVSGKVFSAYREDRHITDRLEYNSNLPVYRIWDFGKTNCVLFVQKDAYGRTRVWHERVLEGSNSVSEQKRIALNDSNTLFPNADFIDICDPAGSYTNHLGVRPEVEQLEGDLDDPTDERLSLQFDRILELPTRERKVRGRQLINKDLQETPNGEEAFQIYVTSDGKGCPILKKAFQGGYCYKKDVAGNITDHIKEIHPYEDVIDCLIYYYLESTGNYSNKRPNIEAWDNVDYRNPYTGL